MSDRNFIILFLLLFLSAGLPALAWGGRGARDFDISVNEDGARDGRISVRIQAKRGFAAGTVNRRGKAFKAVSFKSCLPTRKKGFPEVSYFRMAFQLHDDRDYALVVGDVKFLEQAYTGEWLPSRGQILRSMNPDRVPYKMATAALMNNDFPGPAFVVPGKPFYIRQVRGIDLTVYPVLVNTVQKRVKILKSISFELVPKGERTGASDIAGKSRKILSQNEPVYETLFSNFRWTGELDDGPGHMLVIYTERDGEAVEPFISHKESMGFVVARRQLTEQEEGSNVKNIVKDAYKADGDLMYVQLVGDWEDIQCDTDAWGYPKDNALGEVTGDNYYDLIISRFSAEDALDVTTQVNKVIAYETASEESWWKAGLGVASADGGGEEGDDGESDQQHLSIIKTYKLEKAGYDPVYEEYDPNAAAAGVARAVNNGVHVINYTGHGSTTRWSTTGFSSSDVNALSNDNKLPFIFSVACNNGWYNAGTCFAEAWLRKTGGGAVAAVMSTISQPWDPPMRGQDYMNDLLTGGYDYDVNPGKGINTDHGKVRLGSIVFNAFNLQIAEAAAKEFGDGDVETTQTWILFGDGSLRINSGTLPPCADCSGEPMTGITFEAGPPCICERETPMTLGDEVIVEEGATVTFSAPSVRVTPGFRAAEGAVVNIISRGPD